MRAQPRRAAWLREEARIAKQAGRKDVATYLADRFLEALAPERPSSPVLRRTK